MKHIMFQAIYQ